MKMVQENEHSSECRFFLVFDFEFDCHFSFDCPSEIGNILEFGYKSYLICDEDRMCKSERFYPVIDHHFKVLDIYDLLPKMRHNTQCEIPMSDRIAKSPFR